VTAEQGLGFVSAPPLLPEAAAWLADADLPDELAVAWSGGADSTALLLALMAQGHRVRAWHIDHGWRPGSAAEARWLGQLARRWGLSFHCACSPMASTRNREAEAREFRYRQFAGWAEAQGVGALCLGHQREDQAETVCLRMLQGAGPHGMRGMAAVRGQGELRLHRPLLHVSRGALRQALSQAGVAWLEDASNADVSLWRNRIRHRLFPAMQAAGVDPWRLYRRWGEQAARLALGIDAGLASVPLAQAADRVSVAWSDWAALSPPLRACLLQRMMRMLFGPGVVAGRRHIRMVEAWTVRGGAGGLDLSRSRLHRQRGRLQLASAAGPGACG
jgi:tRNA(Ile)-lysidine synthase